VALAQRIATPNVEINKLFRLVRDDVMGSDRRPPGTLHLRFAAGPRRFLLRREIVPASSPVLGARRYQRIAVRKARALRHAQIYPNMNFIREISNR
jgi:hypothetical protein